MQDQVLHKTFDEKFALMSQGLAAAPPPPAPPPRRERGVAAVAPVALGLHRLQLVDEACDHAEALVPEPRVAGIKAEGG